MARIIVMPDATHLTLGIRGTILYAEQVGPQNLDDLHSSELILERLERAVREDAPLHEQAVSGMPTLIATPEPGSRSR
jgi:hypothetical protein